MSDPTLPELASDVETLIRLRDSRQVSAAVVKQLVAVACWWASNPKGRGVECEYWSKKAVIEWKRDPRWTPGRFVHDHVVPRAFITKRIIDTPLLNAQEIERWLNLSFECVLTPKEHSDFPRQLRASMPAGWDIESDAWDRYKPNQAIDWDGIELHDGPRPF